MGNDFRNDHSIPVPRPDLSIAIGVPNACSQCHSDKSYKWADDYITKWYGIKRKPHFGTIFAKARQGDQSAENALIEIVNDVLPVPIVRATAVLLLGNYSSASVQAAVVSALQSDESLIRYQAVRLFDTNDPAVFAKRLMPLLNDPVKAIRTQAAFKLSALPKEYIGDKLNALNKALNEYIETMNYSADFAASRFNLGVLYSNLKQTGKAIENYRAALQIDSLFFPAESNLAMLLNQTRKNDEAEILLRDLSRRNPEFHSAYYSLGLLLAEKKQYAEAEQFLSRAAQLMPEQTRIKYNLALLLRMSGENTRAERLLKEIIETEPGNFDYRYALVHHYIETEQFEKAKLSAEELKKNFPGSDVPNQLLELIESRGQKKSR